MDEMDFIDILTIFYFGGFNYMNLWGREGGWRGGGGVRSMTR